MIKLYARDFNTLNINQSIHQSIRRRSIMFTGLDSALRYGHIKPSFHRLSCFSQVKSSHTFFISRDAYIAITIHLSNESLSFHIHRLITDVFLRFSSHSHYHGNAASHPASWRNSGKHLDNAIHLCPLIRWFAWLRGELIGGRACPCLARVRLWG